MNNHEDINYISRLKSIQDLDVDYAVKALGGSELLYAELLKKTIRLLPSNIEQMDKHIGEAGDLGAFAVKAHGMKGSLNQIGCFNLAKLAESLEKAAKAGDARYCAGNYGNFKEELLRYYNRLSEAVMQGSGAAGPAEATDSDKKKLVKALLGARESASNFDALAAAEFLAPFANLRFNENTDMLLAKTRDALDRFKNGQALNYIGELLKEYGSPTTFGE